MKACGNNLIKIRQSNQIFLRINFLELQLYSFLFKPVADLETHYPVFALYKLNFSKFSETILGKKATHYSHQNLVTTN